MRIIPLDLKRMVAPFAEGIEIPLQPFFGSMGVAPPEPSGRVSSAPPGIHAGNLDNKELVAGTTLFIPVHVPGALFEVGDGHAAQGDGEVDITALETSLDGTLRIRRPEGPAPDLAPGGDPTHYIAMGIDKDLDEAMKIAVRETVDLLVHREGSPARRPTCSPARRRLPGDPVVDGTKGIHAMIPKSIFREALSPVVVGPARR